MSTAKAWTGGTTVSREHTELHEVIYGYFGPSTAINSYKSPDQQDHELTDVILAAGYRKPPTIDNDKLLIKDGMLLLDVGSCTCTPYGSSHEPHCGLEYLDDLTKPLERAGYRKPRTVTTVEELRELHMVVVRTAAGTIANIVSGKAYCFGYEQSAPLEALALPATVLHEGTAS